ncbi:hypothetical protein ACFQZ4_38580 [Catellatospora coxensis]
MTASGLTRAGWAVGAVAVGAPAGGYLLGYAELLLLGLAAAVALAVAGISVCGALPAAAYLDRLPARTQRDTRTSCRLVVRAPERRRSRACTVHVQVGDARVAVTVPALAAGRDWTGPVSLPTGGAASSPCPRRGCPWWTRSASAGASAPGRAAAACACTRWSPPGCRPGARPPGTGTRQASRHRPA